MRRPTTKSGDLELSMDIRGGGKVYPTHTRHVSKEQVTVGLHQGSALRPILFAILIDCLMWSIQKEYPWDMLFADDVFSGETKEKVEERLVEWKAECE